MKRIFLIYIVFIFYCFSCKTIDVQNLQAAKWVDLTYSFDSSTLYWPNNTKQFVHNTESKGITTKGFYYSSYSICTPEHGGTHLDAPIHFAAKKFTVDEIPLNSLTGNAVLIDVSKNALLNRDYKITISDIIDWGNNNGKIEPNTIILFKTGYGKYYPDRLNYFGTKKIGIDAIPELHFPGIDSSTALFLIKQRKIKSIGLDTPSLDFGQSTLFETHQILMGHNIPGFENLANLDLLPSKNIYVVALPMKIAKGSGAPLRIIAAILK